MMNLNWDLFESRYHEIIPCFDLFLKSLNEALPIGLRKNQIGDKNYSLEKKLKLMNIDYRRPYNLFNFYEVEGERKAWGGDIDHHLGHYFMQALSSLTPVEALDPQKNENVLDMCSAPGGKSAFIAEKMQNLGKLVCCEPDLGRRRVLKSNLYRMGVCNQYIFAGKGQDLKVKDESFDKILCDVPCSSEGTLRNEVIIGKKRRENNYLEYNRDFRKSLHKVQKELLNKAYKLLRPGGVIVYSTCTYDPDENEGQISQFIRENDDCSIVPLDLPAEIDMKLVPGLTYYKNEFHEDLIHSRRMYPHKFNSIGFYVAKIIKQK